MQHFFLVTVYQVSADSMVYNALVEGPSFEFSCYCLQQTTLTTTIVPRLVSKRTVKYFSILKAKISDFQSFLSRGHLTVPLKDRGPYSMQV